MSEPDNLTNTTTENSRKAYIELFAISTVLLFMELAAIRFFGSTVMFLTFFTNIVLLACFLGMSLGCMSAGKQRNYMNLVFPILLFTCLTSCALLFAYLVDPRFLIDVGNQSSPQTVFFGTEKSPQKLTEFIVPMEVIAGFYFIAIAMIFIGPGQVMGRAFNKLSNPVLAYAANIAGSLFGIVLFVISSFFHCPPLVWFSVCLIPCFYWITKFRILQGVCLVAILGIMGAFSFSNEALEVHWSPYNQIVFVKKNKYIFANNISHQEMDEVKSKIRFYSLPYLMMSNAGKQHPFKDIMIIGAGSGNDVAAALDNGVEKIDAVEIDPVISKLGRREHPDKPFDDPKVTIHLDDGRNYLHKTDKHYDMVVYALVDSLALQSGYSSLRLESYLFTKQAFESIKQRLKPGGMFVMCNFYRQDWIAGRLNGMAKEVFGTEPLVLTLADKKETPSGSFKQESITFVIVSNGPNPALEDIRKQFKEGRFYWLNEGPGINKATDSFTTTPPEVTSGTPKEWKRVEEVKIPDLEASKEWPSDSWPFLYLKGHVIPEFNIRGMALMGALSLVLLFLFAPERKPRVNGQMFFLGAAFMLLETKSVVHMALLFGSTWLVNSAVFAAIMIMILFANLLVLKVKPKTLWPFYVLLIISLTVNVFVPMEVFLGMDGVARTLLSCAVTFIPIFFAGTIFAMSFQESKEQNLDLGSNIGGAMLGGLCEYASLMLGFNYLLIVAIVFYLLAFAMKPKLRS